VAHAAAENIKPVSLELGGKSPTIVWKDVDVDEVTHESWGWSWEWLVSLRTCPLATLFTRPRHKS
jgi:hypothetical protein